MQPFSRHTTRRLHLQAVVSPKSTIYSRCFHDSAIIQSGHSRWSKIKHDKGAVDAKNSKARSVFAQEIATASKLFGPDPNNNPRLADLIAKAKKASFAKASIESAIARGQGKSLSGASLDTLTVEGILPQNIAVIIDCETDNKPRTLSDVRLMIKDYGGSATPASYLFTKKGRIVFEKKEGVDVDAVLEEALEVGALDVFEDAEGGIVVLTEPNETTATGEKLADVMELNIATSEIIWDANEETRVPLEDTSAAEALSRFVEQLQEKESSVNGIYLNVAQGSIDEGAWADLQSRITA